MDEEHEIRTLEELLDEITEAAAHRDRISIGHVFEVVGQRSFGPLLLIPGLIAFSPLSGVPGIPTIVGVMVLLITSQILVGRREIWLPQFVLRRSISRARFDQAIGIVRRAARFADRLIKPRFSFLLGGATKYAIATFFLLLSLVAPLLEFLPFVISGVGAALTAFGLALLANDGLLALFALAVCVAMVMVTGMLVF